MFEIETRYDVDNHKHLFRGAVGQRELLMSSDEMIRSVRDKIASQIAQQVMAHLGPALDEAIRRVLSESSGESLSNGDG